MVQKDAVLQQKSPAEFFAENKNIAGFDNVRPASIELDMQLHVFHHLMFVSTLPQVHQSYIDFMHLAI